MMRVVFNHKSEQLNRIKKRQKKLLINLNSLSNKRKNHKSSRRKQ